MSYTVEISSLAARQNQEPRRKRTGYRSRFAPEPQIRIASPRASPQSSGEYVPYSIKKLPPDLSTGQKLAKGCKEGFHENYHILTMETLLQRITHNSEICHGKPCIRGLRYPVESSRGHIPRCSAAKL